MAQLEVKKGNNSVVRRERFVKIAERRVNQILDGLDNLNKCSNRRNYEYTEDEVRKIFREIEKKVRDTKRLFQGEANNKQGFKL